MGRMLFLFNRLHREGAKKEKLCFYVEHFIRLEEPFDLRFIPCEGSVNTIRQREKNLRKVHAKSIYKEGDIHV